MDKKKKVIVTFILLIILVAGFWLISKAITTYTGYSVTGIKNLDKFVNCLNEKKVELYVTNGCPHCKKQKELFKGYLDNLKVIDCIENSELCVEKNIFQVPTWIINNQKYVREKSLEEISELSGCELNK